VKYKKIILISFAGLLAACTEPNSNENKTGVEPVIQTASINKVKRVKDFAQITRGGKVFQKNCISCHGANAEGQSNWKQTDANGKYPAPPLNGTGHAWHHTNAVNTNSIKNGTIHLGGSMPAWKDKLSDQEISDVIAWFQSKWTDKVYWTWYEKVEKSK